MSNVLYRQFHTPLPIMSYADGVVVTDTDGRQFLDATAGGVAVTSIGYRNKQVQEAIRAQLSKGAYIHGSFFSSHPAEELAEYLLQIVPGAFERVLFTSGGSESNESALKLVRQAWLESGKPQKNIVISRQQSYHGASCGALSISGNQFRRAPYAPYLFEALFIEPCYAYRYQQDDESAKEYGIRAANQLEQAILSAGPERVAAFIAEPIVGATLGAVPAIQGYFKRIREICDQYDVFLIFDEIMCGSGRTGTFFACEYDGVYPDILTVAKGLGGGFQPIGATFVGARIIEAIQNGSGVLKHGFTYMGHPVACAAALEVQKIIREQNLLANARTQGKLLLEGLEEKLADHPHVGNVRGRGLFAGVEIVADKESKKPFEANMQIAARMRKAALSKGLMIYPGAGTADGVNGDHVLFSPAYTITSEQTEEVIIRFEETLKTLWD